MSKKVFIFGVVVILALIIFLFVGNGRDQAPNTDMPSDKNLNSTKQSQINEKMSPEVKEWRSTYEEAITTEDWQQAAEMGNQLAEHYEAKGDYETAVKYWEEAGDYWLKAERPSFVVANTIRADQIRTEMSLYVEQPLPANEVLAKFEPPSGTYLGLYMAGKKENNDPDVVEVVYGRNHAIYLTYAHWRKKYEATDSYFPLEFAENAKRNGSGIQVAWEPSNGLDDVHDDEYVRQFAREAKQAGVPIFLRFAGEMNGEWVPWHDEPETYREKFKLIHDIMEEEAPNVAMVWSPNFLPRHNIDPFYPGDDVVDWVGLSLYTIPFSHGREVPGGNPIDYLKPIYDEYSHKPMMISEGAVSHVSYEQEKDYSEWAVGQIGNMYGFLPKMFPKMKAITYFNLDKRTTSYDNQNNNYDLADSDIVETQYKKIIQHPYFIDHLNLNEEVDAVQTQYVPIDHVTETSGMQNAFVYVKLPQGVQPHTVAVYQGDHKLGESTEQPWEMQLNLDDVNREQEIVLIAYDEDGDELAIQEVKLLQ